MSAYDEVADWPIVPCESCSYPFGQEAQYMRSCQVCFKSEKGYKLLKGDLAVARLQLALDKEMQARKNPETASIDAELHASLLRENESLKATVQQLKSELRVSRKRSSGSAGTALSPEQVIALIKLCHPDKHQNNEQSTEVTKWLLDLRNKP